MNTVAPVWDGNETLILGGGGLCSVSTRLRNRDARALRAVYRDDACAGISRVSFEYRWRDPDHRWWDRSFHWGSIVMTFMQGIVLGAFARY